MLQFFAMIGTRNYLFCTTSIVLMIFTANYNFQVSYGHNFTPDESASFLAFTYEMQVESELVKANLLTNNISFAQIHANNTGSLLTPIILAEIVEKDPVIANDLRRGVNDLVIISSSRSNQQQIDDVLSDINSTLSKAVNIRISDQTADSSNLLDKVTDFLGDIFQTDSNQMDITGMNSTVLGLSFANLVDSVLINYGSSFGVEFDMTNMTNMAMMGSNNMSGSNGEMHMSSMVKEHGMNNHYSLVDITEYQSAQALSKKANDIFYSKLKPLIVNENYITSFVSNLEDALNQLDSSIASKASPTDIMMIAHTQIHPNLSSIFNLETRD